METGPSFLDERLLADGTPVIVRHIRPADADELRRGFARLSPASRFRRFLGVVSSLTDEQLRYLTEVDQERHVALVVTTRPAEEGQEPVGLAVGRFVREADDPDVAELAITVADEWQGKGIGRMLAMALARAAQERGVKRFRGEVLADNDAVRGLLEDVGAVVKESDGSLVFDVELTEMPSEAGSRLDVAARKLLRAAATFLAGLFGEVKERGR